MPRRGRFADTVRGLGGLARLGVLVVGVPVALVALVRVVAPGSGGAPWPAGLPRLDEVTAALARPAQVPSTTLVKLVALVAWLGWLQLSLAVVADVVGRVGGRAPWRLPLPLAGRSQALAGRLVASAALVSALWWQPSRTAPAPASATLSLVVAAPDAGAHPARAGQLPPLSPGTKVHLVRPGDWLSKIAEAHLGSWRRYPEIVELNRGRPQVDGRALVNEDLIRPGWVLAMPDDAVGVDVVPQPAPPPPAARSGEPTPRQAAPVVVAPAPGTTPPSALVTAATPKPPASPVARPDGNHAGARGDGDARGALGAALAVGVPAMVAAGVMWKLWGLRQAQQRRRRRGRDVPRSDPALEPVERRMRAVASAEAAEWLDLALRYLGVALAEWPVGSLPAIDAVRAGRFGVEILLDRACPMAPARFVAADEGRVWRLDAAVELGDLKVLAGDAGPLVPGLLSIGTTAEGPLLIDLERAGTLSVEGDVEAVAAFLAGAALELASAAWAVDTPVRLIGGDARLATLEQVELIVHPEALAAAPWAGLDLGEATTTLAGRLGAEEAFPPTVVIAAPGAASDEVLRRLCAKAEAGAAGLVLVAPGPIPGTRWRLVIGADREAVLEPLGISVRCAVEAETVHGLIGLLAGAGTNEEGDELLALTEPADQEVVPAEEAIGPLVRVLGPVEVPWDTPPARRVRSEEIVAYLATHHPRVVPRDRLLVAVHPLRDDGRAGEVAGSTFRAEVSRVRVALGRDPDGQWYLPTASRAGYRIRTASDWSRFCHLTARARSRPPAETIGLLEEALALVRGRPFEDVPECSYGWAWSEQVVSTIEVAVAEVAEQLAELALDADQPGIARWAARQGLLVIPSREALYQAWMRAAAAAGNLDDLDQAWRDVWRAVRAIDPMEEPRPDTMRLYESLRDTSRRVPEPAG